MKRLAKFFDSYPLAAVWLGILAAFILMELSAALIKH